MERQRGYYWVKIKYPEALQGEGAVEIWEAHKWSGIVWLTLLDHPDIEVSEVNENRIPSPDELKGELLSNMSAIIDHGSKFTYNPENNDISIFKKGEPQILVVTVSAGVKF
jgi:hypothetical protein